VLESYQGKADPIKERISRSFIRSCKLKLGSSVKAARMTKRERYARYLWPVFLATILLPVPIYGMAMTSGQSNDNRPFVKYTLFLSNDTLVNGDAASSGNSVARIDSQDSGQVAGLKEGSPTAGMASSASVTVGGVPNGIAFDPFNGNLYVANFAPGTLSVINGSTNSVTATVNLNFPVSPWDVAYDPHNGNIYISETKNGAVSVVNGENNTVAGTVAVGDDMLSGDHDDRPNGVAYDPYDHEMYVVMYGSGYLAEINSDANVLIGNAPINYTAYANRGLWGVAFNPSNCYFYAGNALANTVTVVNAATNSFVSSINVGRSPNGLAVETVQGSGYGNVFVANYAANTVSVINGTSNRLIDTISVGQNPDGIALDSVSGDFYVANFGDGTISVIDGTTDSVVSTLTVGSGASGVAYDPVNGDIYVTDSNIESVSIISTGDNLSAIPPPASSAQTANSSCDAAAHSSNTTTETSQNSTFTSSTSTTSIFMSSSSSTQIGSFSTTNHYVQSSSTITTTDSMSISRNVTSAQDSVSTSGNHEEIFLFTIAIAITVVTVVLSLFLFRRIRSRNGNT
jgi:YVTN family beta-propeller protein